ncbi:MAG: phosphatidate cytidylyltransferase [Burkholderiales bacterium]
MLRLRILSAVAMAAVLLVVLVWLPPLGLTVFVGVVLLIGAWEWGGLARLGGLGRGVYSTIIVAITIIALVWTGPPDPSAARERFTVIFWIATIFWIGAVPIWIRSMPFEAPRSIVMLAGIIVLPATGLAIIDLRSAGVGVLLAIMAIVWVADVTAYFVGRAYGKHKLAPNVSPGKTVEGAVGALFGVACYAIAITLAFQLVGASVGVVLGVAVGLGAAGIVGDLFESALKRQAGLKDSGNILPGHGGILDRIDALLPVLPMAALLLPR